MPATRAQSSLVYFKGEEEGADSDASLDGLKRDCRSETLGLVLSPSVSSTELRSSLLAGLVKPERLGAFCRGPSLFPVKPVLIARRSVLN